MLKQILPNLNIEYETYCEECSVKDFSDINIISFSNGNHIQYIKCSNAKTCKNLAKRFNLVEENLYK